MSERFEARYLNSQTGFENSVLSFRPEPHVAQQRRRDKLRTNHTHDIPNHLLHLPNDPDLVHALDQTMFSSEMLNFSMSTHGVLQQESAGSLQSGRPLGPDDVTFGNSPKVAGPHWKGIGSQQPGCDWFVNYVNGAGGGNACNQNQNQNQNQTPLYVAEPLYGSHREANVSAFSTHPNHGYQDVVQPSYANTAIPIAAIPITSHQECSKQYGDLNFSSPSFYHNALQEVVTSSTKGTQSDHCAWVDSGSEQVALPIYGNQFVATRVNNSESWMHRQLDGTSTQWNGEVENNRSLRHLDRVVGESTSRGLSLSLSSHSPSNVAQMGERFIPENLQSRTEVCNGYQESKCNNSGYICSSSKPSTVNSFHGNSVQGVAITSDYPRRGIGPLGPFTGYATILKNSKFLKPAQLLLDEICNVAGSKLVRTRGSSERGSREASSSSSPIFAENEAGRRGGSSDVSSSFNSSNQAGAGGRLGSGSCQAYNPEYQQKKAKLLYMQEEICRRYKQYHQQMQMVVSSFETVAGLSSATPYTSSALKAITRHFQCLRNAISDQINLITKTRGEELLSPAVGITNKGDSTMSKLRCIDPNVRKQQAGGEYLSIIERQAPQHPIWRPQRGLPERAVAVLKAWLFEHFLHPYPTDTDKHMLATQTGLSRNQVSNWFINARVRVWKPMVEEMHMLETKGSTDTDHSSGNNPKLDNNGNVGCSGDQSSNKLMIDAMSEKLPECSAIQSLPAEVGESSEQWPHHEKRFRVERQLPTTVDNGLISFIPYQHSGLGAVSLTLGLRHSTDHQQQHEHQLRHYGGQMIHDFVG